MASAFCRVRTVSVNQLLKTRTLRPLIPSFNALSTEHPPISEETERRESIVTRRLAALVKWYEEITGMDEVRRAQNRVLEAEEKFIAAQERRRETSKAVTEIQTKLKDIHTALDSTTRGEDRYVQLITQEHQILKEERKLMTEFQQLEREEREYFSMLSSAVKESHEQERAQAEKTKYWSIIGSIIGTIIGVVGSSVNNSLKMKELRKLIKDSVSNSDSAFPTASLSDNEVIKQLKHVVNILNENTRSDINRSGNSINVTDSLDRQTVLIDKHFRELKSMLNANPISTKEFKDDQVVLVSNDFEKRLQNRQAVTHLLIVGSAFLVITIPYLLKYTGLM